MYKQTKDKLSQSTLSKVIVLHIQTPTPFLRAVKINDDDDDMAAIQTVSPAVDACPGPNRAAVQPPPLAPVDDVT